MPDPRQRTPQEIRRLQSLAMQIWHQLPENEEDAAFVLGYARELLRWRPNEYVLEPPAPAPVLKIVR